MNWNGITYRLTKHGRKRCLERIGNLQDDDILKVAIKGAQGYVFKWAPDKKDPQTTRRLVTVLIDQSKCVTLS